MKWSGDADIAIKKVPFFIRKKVRKKVEAYAAEKGKNRVDLTDVNELKARFLSKGGMESQIKGFEVSTCFGGSGCPNVAHSGTHLARKIEAFMEAQDLKAFLKSRVKGDLKFHHEFKVVLADCPNACSRPQIADIGIIGAQVPEKGDEACSQCGECVLVCKEGAISLDSEGPLISMDKCLACGQCIPVCPTGTLIDACTGFRVFLGGRLGRHPRLAMEVPGILTHEQVMDLVKRCMEFYKTRSTDGSRFSHLLDSVDQVWP